MKRAAIAAALFTLFSLICPSSVVMAFTSDQQRCLDADKTNDAHALDNYCVIAASQGMDLSQSSSNIAEAQQAQLGEAGFLFLAAKGAMLTMQFKLGLSELSNAHSLFKSVRDHGVTRVLRIKAMNGLSMVDGTLDKLSHLGEQ